MRELAPLLSICLLQRFARTTTSILLAGLGVANCDAGTTGTARAGADADRGQRLLMQYQCGSCHTIPGVAAARGVRGPSLEAFGKRSYIAGRIPNRAEALARWISAPQSLVPDTAMPNMGVSNADARDMAAYLGRLQ